VLEPVLSDSACSECHQSGEAVRGVIKLTTSLETVETDIRNSWLMSIGMVGVGVLFIFTAVYFIAKRSVVNPIRAVVKAMAVAAKGDLSVKIPVTGNDEISRMAESFNQMSGQLGQLYEGLQDEQNKLTTIILGSNEGIIVTDPNNKAVLVNPAASEILGKSRERILQEGILMLVDDPEWMKSRLAARNHEESAGLIEFNGRILSIEASTTRGTSGHITGSAAIVRDVTEETRLAAELKRLAVTDGLTGLYNRRHFDEVMQAEFKRARRYNTHFSLILLDVDHFKNFNDTYGHDCGDRVLKAIGAVLRDVAGRQWPESKVHASKVGIACRYGGEELAIVLPELSRAEAAIVAETARREIAQLRVDGMQVTASLGVAAYSESHQRALDMVVSADEALYRAKEAGRNCVMLGH
jgi:diguanylate cyclase (GGDEF)-like protein/PAS domain S-box-containing protein